MSEKKVTIIMDEKRKQKIIYWFSKIKMKRWRRFRVFAYFVPKNLETFGIYSHFTSELLPKQQTDFFFHNCFL